MTGPLISTVKLDFISFNRPISSSKNLLYIPSTAVIAPSLPVFKSTAKTYLTVIIYCIAYYITHCHIRPTLLHEIFATL